MFPGIPESKRPIREKSLVWRGGGSGNQISKADRSVGFSLIELLVVMAVMAILVTVGVSALSSPKQGEDVTRAGGTLGDLAGLARQYSLSKNTRTVLLVAQISDGGVTRSAASIWDASATNQLEKWNLLPETVLATNSSDFAGTAFAGAKYRGQSLASPGTYWFYPDGRMGDDPSQIPKLKVLPQRGNLLDTYELIFNPTTGTFKASRS